MKCDLSKKN